MNANATAITPPKPEESQSEESLPEESLPEESVPESPAPERSAPEPSAPEPDAASEPAAVPEPRAAAEGDGEAERGKAKKPRRTVRAKSAGGTKALVVWREGRLHYADDSVLVIDLDEAASPDVDVHDVVDRLAELREAIDSPGRTETVAALGEIIQEKALN